MSYDPQFTSNQPHPANTNNHLPPSQNNVSNAKHHNFQSPQQALSSNTNIDSDFGFTPQTIDRSNVGYGTDDDNESSDDDDDDDDVIITDKSSDDISISITHDCTKPDDEKDEEDKPEPGSDSILRTSNGRFSHDTTNQKGIYNQLFVSYVASSYFPNVCPQISRPLYHQYVSGANDYQFNRDELQELFQTV